MLTKQMPTDTIHHNQFISSISTGLSYSLSNCANIDRYREVVPEQLHYKRAVLVGIFVQRVQLSYGIIKSLLITHQQCGTDKTTNSTAKMTTTSLQQ